MVPDGNFNARVCLGDRKKKIAPFVLAVYTKETSSRFSNALPPLSTKRCKLLYCFDERCLSGVKVRDRPVVTGCLGIYGSCVLSSLLSYVPRDSLMKPLEVVADLHVIEEPDSFGWDRWMAESTDAAALPGGNWDYPEAETANRAVGRKEAFGDRNRVRFQKSS